MVASLLSLYLSRNLNFNCCEKIPPVCCENPFNMIYHSKFSFSPFDNLDFLPSFCLFDIVLAFLELRRAPSFVVNFHSERARVKRNYSGYAMNVEEARKTREVREWKYFKVVASFTMRSLLVVSANVCVSEKEREAFSQEKLIVKKKSGNKYFGATGMGRKRLISFLSLTIEWRWLVADCCG